MRIGGGGSADINLLQSDAGQFRNEAYAVDQGLCFQGGYFQVAVAAKYAQVQIFNPVASGKTILLDGMSVAGTGNTYAEVRIYNTALATLSAAWVSRKSGGAVGVGEIRYTTDAAQFGSVINYVDVLDFETHRIDWRFPWILAAGKGVLIGNSNVNQGMSLTAWGREF